MSSHNFFKRLIAPKQKPLVGNFDKKLVKSINRNFFPSLTQFKYLFHFLNPTEKSIITISSSIIGLTLAIWGIFFFIHHSAFTPKNGGEYSEAMVGQPKFINPIFSSTNDVDADLTSLIYSGLFRYDKNSQLVPDLVKEYSISENKKTYTVTLKDDLKWSDGEPITANDVVYTFETIQNIEVGSPLFTAFHGVTIEKKDNNTVTFTLKESYAPFLHSLTVGILPEHAWADTTPSSIKLTKTNLQPVGSGPWKFEKMLKDDTGNIQAYTLTVNDKYYGKIPYLKTATFRFYADYQTAIDALRSQAVSAISFIPRQYEDKLAKKSLNFHPLQLPQYTALFFNETANADLKDDDLRLALAQAIDKQKIIDEAIRGEAKVIDSPILSGDVGYYPEIKKIVFNPAEADALLDKKWKKIAPEDFYEIKYKETLKNRQTEIDEITKNASSTPDIVSSTIAKIESDVAQTVREQMVASQQIYRKDKNDHILSITITTADTAEYTKVAETIATLWRNIGVNVNISTISSRQFSRETLKPREYQVLLYGEILGSDPDPYPFWHSSQTEYPGLNLSMYVNRNADKLLEDARVTDDQAKRVDNYKKFQDLLVKDLPAVFLYTPSYNFVVDKNIKGIEVGKILSPTDRFQDMGNWYIKTKWGWK